MKGAVNFIAGFIFCALLYTGIGYFFLGCFSDTNCPQAKDVDTGYLYDKKPYELPEINNPTPDSGYYLVEDLFPDLPDTVYDTKVKYKDREVDTPAILAKYDKEELLFDFIEYRTYRETLEDTSVKIDADIGVYKNRLDEFKLTYQIKRPTLIETTEFNTYSTKVWGGLNLQPDALHAELELDKKYYKLSAGYELIGTREYNSILERFTVGGAIPIYQN